MTSVSGEFRKRVEGAFGSRGERWLEHLPGTIERYARRWELENLAPPANLSYAWVAFADSAYGPAVLKLNVPNPEAVTEAAALALFPAPACCRLYDDDREAGALLLERLDPGTPLRATPSFESRTETAAEVLARLHGRSVDTREAGRSAAGFPRYLDQAARAFRTARRVLARDSWQATFLHTLDYGRSFADVLQDRISQAGGETLLHADVHHDNILRAGGSFRLIDPKGTIGPLALEAGRFIINQYYDAGRRERREQFSAMIEAFAKALGVSQGAVAAGAALDSVVSACWSVEDHDDEKELRAAASRAEQVCSWARAIACP